MSEFADEMPHEVPEEWYLRFLEGPKDGAWPQWVRTLYLVTFPVSFPLYWTVWVIASVAAYAICWAKGY